MASGAYPFVPAPQTLLCEQLFTSNGIRCENVFHVGYTGAITNLLAVATALRDMWRAWENLQGVLVRPSATVSTGLRVKDIGVEFGGATELTMGSNPGGIGGVVMPNNVTCAIKWLTANTGKSFRGRTYHIGMTDQMCAGNNLIGGYDAKFITAYTALMNSVASVPAAGGASAFHLVIVSKRHNNAWRDNAVVTPVLGPALTNTIVDTQRRRMR
jgi:hypothetical protein